MIKDDFNPVSGQNKFTRGQEVLYGQDLGMLSSWVSVEATYKAA